MLVVALSGYRCREANPEGGEEAMYIGIPPQRLLISLQLNRMTG